MGLIITGCARLRRNYIQIKNFLNSYRAGAHSNSVTLDVSALFSVARMSLAKLSLAGNNEIISGQEVFG